MHVRSRNANFVLLVLQAISTALKAANLAVSSLPVVKVLSDANVLVKTESTHQMTTHAGVNQDTISRLLMVQVRVLSAT